MSTTSLLIVSGVVCVVVLLGLTITTGIRRHQHQVQLLHDAAAKHGWYITAIYNLGSKISISATAKNLMRYQCHLCIEIVDRKNAHKILDEAIETWIKHRSPKY
jgi:hypothetical protein